MDFTIFKDTITKKNLQTYLSKRVYEKQYWPSFFTLKPVTKLSVETLIGSEGHRVAAPVVSFSSPAPRKRRPTVDKLMTTIPPIRVARAMDENDLNEYFALMAQASDAMQKAAIKLVFNDIDFVVDSCLARLEFMALQVLAHGTLTLDTTNNEGVITTTDVDFQLPAANQEYIGSAGGTAAATHYWTAAVYNTNDPITDIQAIVQEAKNAGSHIKHILMNYTKFADFQLSDAVQNFCRAFTLEGTAYRTPPSVDTVNAVFRAQGLPEIHIIDTRINLEIDGVQTAVDPFEHLSVGDDAYVTFLPELNCGNILYCPTAEERAPAPQAIYAKKGPILVSKFRTTDPVSEVTVGLVNAMVSWPKIDKAWILNSESHTAF